MADLSLQQRRALVTVLYLLGVVGIGTIFILVGTNLPNPNHFLADIGGLEILFGIVLAKPAIRYLQRRILQDFKCSGCNHIFLLTGRWRCVCQAVSIRHAFTRCQRPE